MLLGGKQSDIKQVAVMTRSLQFKQLLSSILSDWKFFAVEDLAEARVVFAEHGIDLPDSAGDVVWLAGQPLSKGRFLTRPISLTSLYQLLETEYFPTPRRHIRIALDVPVKVCLKNVREECRLISLADRGGRIVCQDEILPGTMLQLDMHLGGKLLQLPAETLYSIPAGDASCRALPQVGILFRPEDNRVTGMLRRFIEKTCVESACAREGISPEDPCLGWIDFVDDPWQELSR